MGYWTAVSITTGHLKLKLVQPGLVGVGLVAVDTLNPTPLTCRCSNPSMRPCIFSYAPGLNFILATVPNMGVPLGAKRTYGADTLYLGRERTARHAEEMAGE